MSEFSFSDVKVAVVGCGGWGKNLVRNFHELGALAAVVDPNPETARAFAETYGCLSADFETVLADPGITGIVIAAPAVLHFELARRALEAGKHCYVEKPLALNPAEAGKLCELAEAKALHLMVGHLLQYHPVFLKIRDMVADGQLGRVEYVYSNRLNLGKLRTEEDVLWSFAPHDISMILALIGSEPDHVEANGSYFLNSSLADAVTVQLGFASGQRAHVFVSWLHPTKEQKLVVVGDKGMAVFDDTLPWDAKLQFFAHAVDWKNGAPVAVKAEAEIIDVPQQEPLKLECAHFLECIAQDRRPRTDGNEGARVLNVLAKAAASLEAKKKGATEDPAKAAAHSGVMIHESAYVDDGVKLGAGTRIWHFSHILGDAEIGQNCNIGQNVVVGPSVLIGDSVKIQNNVSVYKGVTLEDGVFCGPSCVFTNVNNPRAEVERKAEFLPTLVRKGATIGANATIVCGHSLGRYCFIAAGAVVATDVPDHALMAGVPARRIGWMSKAGARLGEDLVCPLDGTRYRETGDGGLEPATT